MNTSVKTILVFCFILLCHFHGSYAGGESDEVEFSYEVRSRRGPSRWARLDPDWFLCGNGTMQSPIAINDRMTTRRPTLGPLQTNYVRAPATLSSSGHDVQVLWAGPGGAGNITINGTVFKVVEAHWHKPAEHILNGIRHAMELHLVHESATGQIAVVAVLYRYGRADPFIERLYNAIRSLERREGQVIDVGMVDPRDIDQYNGTNNNYYRYMGSLTTPPCSENIIWTIREKIQTVSRRQVRALEEAIDDDDFEENARPVQPLNGRPVFKFEQ